MRFGGTFFICFVLLSLGLMFMQGWGLLFLAALLIAGTIHAYLSIIEHLEKIEKHLGIFEENESDKTLFERLSEEDRAQSPETEKDVP